jgi:hypothetical protein
MLVLAEAAAFGCGRTALDGRRVEGSAETPDARSWLDGRRLDGSAVATDTRAPCTPGPSQPASLIAIDKYFPVEQLAAAGGLVFTIVESYGDSPAPIGHIASISVATSAMATTEVGEYFPLALTAYSGGVLVPAGKMVVTGNAWSVRPTQVIRFSPVDRSWSLLTDPSLESSSSINAVAGNENLRAFWIRSDRETGERLLERWEPSGVVTRLVTANSDMTGLQASNSTVYWRGVNADGYPAFQSVPVTGGDPMPVWQATSSASSESVALIGQDDGSLYFFYTSVGPAGIMAVSKADGVFRTVVPDSTPSTFAMDATHVYWWTLNDQYTLFRASNDGGPTETLYHGRLLSAVALDECNVYWLVANPCEIFYQAK